MIMQATKDIRLVREVFCLTQEEAGAMVNVLGRTWSKYESGERPIPPAKWKLFISKLPKRNSTLIWHQSLTSP